ncbi:hypothetical protein [Parasphingorhabdus halotolerans]|uniref:Phosphatidate cytidylyltransferase n=1 Tax=Parasphingorhabdus halotolerans TaxID=2725558 RepID=A0A6H2DKV5_9SPHN|nr:hypothetical protein [Parasphingorhabdus halotolerans]QJB69302.1 hypothetical protein HF685_08425 [Parasphingorhabdus halotolerans]
MSELIQLIKTELAQPVDPRVVDFAASIAAQYGEASRAVLFYGSCLRTTELDGQMLDFYLIVSSYEVAYGKSWLVRANKLLPPNVFPAEHDGLVAKIAVLSEEDFARLCSVKAGDVSVWARFAQPSRLVWLATNLAPETIVEAIAEAPVTLFQRTLPVMGAEYTSLSDIWREGFSRTYDCELRAERAGRSSSVVDCEPERYERLGMATTATIAKRMGVGPNGEVPNFASPDATEQFWRKMKRRGKLLTLARLAKASGTYAGGIDYLAWKINRHAGTGYVIKPWQRKWPILGALTMLPRLIAGGAIK